MWVGAKRLIKARRKEGKMGVAALLLQKLNKGPLSYQDGVTISIPYRLKKNADLCVCVCVCVCVKHSHFCYTCESRSRTEPRTGWGETRLLSERGSHDISLYFAFLFFIILKR